jgi:tetratricopeptide (TPR) repeat protein
MSRVRLIVLIAVSIAASSDANAQIPVKTARRAAPVVRPTERRAAPDEPASTAGDSAANSEANKEQQFEKDAATQTKQKPKAAGQSFASDETDSRESTVEAPAPTGTRLRIGAQAAEQSSAAQDTTAKPSVSDPPPAAAIGALPPRSAEPVEPVKLAPLAFHGITPAVSTLHELDSTWGPPTQDRSRQGNGRRHYKIEPHKNVEVTLEQGKVTSVVVYLAAPLDVEKSRTRFAPGGLNPVEITDESGDPLGLAYPERGVAFSYANNAREVARVLFEPIDEESFLLRSQTNWRTHPRQSLADAQFVLSRKPDHAAAHWTAAQICYEAGQLSDASKSIEKALKVQPANAEFLLTKCRILAESGDYTTARQICQSVLDSESGGAAGSPETRAKALCLMGDLIASGPGRDHKRALDYHLAAIQAANRHRDAKRPSLRRAAKHVLVEANLGAANDIAWGYWQQKERIVPKWLSAADIAADDLLRNEGADPAIHLLVVRKSLAASAGTQGKVDPVDWTKDAIRTARELTKATDDAWRRQRLEWELGLALYDALQADQARGYHEHALSNSSLVVKHLEAAAMHRQQTPHEVYLLGRLYFRVGVLHAIEKQDHTTAVAWFDKSRPLLERPLPATAASDVGWVGESFVSMGISYWQVGRKEDGVRMTEHGLALVEQGIKDKVIGDHALTAPYTNLAYMHRELGDDAKASGFIEMATRADDSRRR